MQKITRHIITSLLFCSACGSGLAAQRPDRLAGGIDGRDKIRIQGTRNPRIVGLASEGPVDGALRVAGISFLFRPSAAQSAELDKLLEDQQDPGSPRYHAWLTPEQYGERFGLSSGDFQKVRQWIESQGFQVDNAARSRAWITFSGTAAQVRNTFLTDLHRFQVDGKARYANMSDAALPRELEPLIYTIEGLHDIRDERIPPAQAQFNLSTGGHALTPGDLHAIYNLQPLFDEGLDGSGQTIVISGQSAFQLSDIRRFRLEFNLPDGDPQVLLVPGSRDPGRNGDETEALMDLAYAGAAAPNAKLVYVYAEGVTAAVRYAVDQNLAPVISHSYGVCERNVSLVDGAAEAFRNLAQQANAQGITWISSSGDTGPSACEQQQKDSAGLRISVNVPASLPEVTAVGGTRFQEQPGGAYWNSRMTSAYASALSYIPETAWNDTAENGTLAASGGGTSVLYAKPAWQTGPGVPGENMRHLPDIAFAASWDHDPYLIIRNGEALMAGGTSIAAPFFAGVAALLNQHVVGRGAQVKPGLGNINPRLYQLAQAAPGIFHDITTGDNVIPCKRGTPACTTGKYGFEAGPGYDRVTGLGSVDVKSLVDNWIDPLSNSGAKGSVVVAAVDPTPVVQQAPDSEGYEWYYTLRLDETGGKPTKVTAFSISGYDLSAHIAAWFGSAALPANGTLRVALRSKDLPVPMDVVFAFGGADEDGRRWTTQLSVPFLPRPAATAELDARGLHGPPF